MRTCRRRVAGGVYDPGPQDAAALGRLGLSPWLLTVVNLACKAALRSEFNRRFRETEAAKCEA